MPPRLLARSIAALFLIAVTAFGRSATATTLRTLDLDDLAQGATDIVVARVESVTPRWTKNGRSIVTEVRVAVEERLKGEDAPTLTLITPGGEIDGIRVEVDAVPAFVVGERCVLFANRVPGTARAHLYGLEQGKFEVLSDADGVLKVRSTGAIGETPRLTPPPRSREFPFRAAPTFENFLKSIRNSLGDRGVAR